MSKKVPTPEEIQKLTELKEYALKRNKFTIAAIVRDMEKQAIQEFNQDCTENLISRLEKEINEQEEKNIL